MGRHKKKSPSPDEPPFIPAEAQKQLTQMLVHLKDVMSGQNEDRTELSEFHKRIGKFSVADMNAKERAEARQLYLKMKPKTDAATKHIMNLLNSMKRWRERSIEAARERNELNAIELMKARHGCQPVWDLEENPECYGAGAVQWPENKRLSRKDEVAAFVDSSKTWILAEVVGPVSNHRYECFDIDDQERKIATFARKQLIPLPKYTVFYDRYPYMAIKKRGIVLAIFPGTTCFYEGIVHEPPQSSSGYYQIRFVDNQKPDNYGNPVEVSERYVVPFKKDPKMYIRPEKREELAKKQQEAAEELEAMEEQVPEKKESPKKGRKPKIVVVEEEKPGVTDEKDVPGPAPPAPKSMYYESPDEEPVKKSKKGKKLVKKQKKVKVLRARVPEHKKRMSTRQFGKRRVKRNKSAPGTKKAAGGSAEEPVVVEEQEEQQDAEAQEAGDGRLEQEEQDSGSRLDEYEDARADLSNTDEAGDEIKEKEEEESSDDSDDEKEEVVEEKMEIPEEVKNEETEQGEKQSSESSESSSSDSDDSDDSYMNRFARRPKQPLIRESDLSDSPVRSSSSSEESDA